MVPLPILSHAAFGLYIIDVMPQRGTTGGKLPSGISNDRLGIKKKKAFRSSFFGARNRTWTCTSFDTRTWNVRVYQFRHPGCCFCELCFRVPRTRLELARLNRHYPLKVACLPIPPPGHFSLLKSNFLSSRKRVQKYKHFCNWQNIFFKKAVFYV